VILTGAIRNAQLEAIATAVNSGAGPGKLQVWSGTKPTDPASTPSGTKLAEVTLNDPAFDAAASNAMALDVSPAVSDPSADATGTATFARLVDSNGNGHVLLSVGTSGAEVNFVSLSFVLGQVIGITSLNLTQPTGTI
jgi:hypothetical protein